MRSGRGGASERWSKTTRVPEPGQTTPAVGVPAPAVARCLRTLGEPAPGQTAAREGVERIAHAGARADQADTLAELRQPRGKPSWRWRLAQGSRELAGLILTARGGS